MFAPNIVTHVKFRPLLPIKEMEAAFNSKKVLQAVRRELKKEIEDRIMLEPFSQAAKLALSKGFKLTVGDRSLQLEATHPAFRPLLQGQKRGQMTWLTKARAPIPIVLPNGKTIFRSATPRSMADGSWYHPGRQSTQIIDMARDATRKVIKRQLQKQLKRMMRQK